MDILKREYYILNLSVTPYKINKKKKGGDRVFKFELNYGFKQRDLSILKWVFCLFFFFRKKLQKENIIYMVLSKIKRYICNMS